MDLMIEFWSELAEMGKDHPIFWRKHEKELLFMLIENGFPYSSYQITSRMKNFMIWQLNNV